MASKIRYNNVQYDILDIIPIRDKEYIFMSNPDDINDIRYIEKSIEDGKEKYSLPPRNLSIENNQNTDLKQMQINSFVSHIVDILKQNIKNGVLKNNIDAKKQLLYIERLIGSNMAVKGILDDDENLDFDNYQNVVDSLNHYLDSQFLINIKDNNQEEAVDTSNEETIISEGLDYENLYNLSSAELEKIANQPHTSEELIYISDALNKRLATERAIENYTSGYSKTYRKNNRAAFVDILLLTLITGSFWLLMLIALF